VFLVRCFFLIIIAQYPQSLMCLIKLIKRVNYFMERKNKERWHRTNSWRTMYLTIKSFDSKSLRKSAAARVGVRFTVDDEVLFSDVMRSIYVARPLPPIFIIFAVPKVFFGWCLPWMFVPSWFRRCKDYCYSSIPQAFDVTRKLLRRGLQRLLKLCQCWVGRFVSLVLA